MAARGCRLTTAFDFARPEAWRSIALPDTDAYRPPDFDRRPDLVLMPPANQALPTQEPGVRPARAIPYTMHAHGAVQDVDGSVPLDFHNTGGATVVFHVRSANQTDQPRSYTVGPHSTLSDTWAVTALGLSRYDLAVYGPNGFFRAFRGGVSRNGSANVSVQARNDHANNRIALAIMNGGVSPVAVSALDKYTARA